MAKTLITNEDGSVKPMVFYALVGALVIGGGYLLVRAWKGSDESLPVAMMCWSPGCGHKTSALPQQFEEIPTACPKCGKKTFAPSYTCRHCGTGNVWNCYRGIEVVDKCPKCGKEVRYGRR